MHRYYGNWPWDGKMCLSHNRASGVFCWGYHGVVVFLLPWNIYRSWSLCIHFACKDILCLPELYNMFVHVSTSDNVQKIFFNIPKQFRVVNKLKATLWTGKSDVMWLFFCRLWIWVLHVEHIYVQYSGHFEPTSKTYEFDKQLRVAMVVKPIHSSESLGRRCSVKMNVVACSQLVPGILSTCTST